MNAESLSMLTQQNHMINAKLILCIVDIPEGIQKAVQGTIIVSQLELNLPGELQVCSSQNLGRY